MRILCEETGVADVYLEQLYTFGQPDRDPAGRVVSVAYFALIHAAGIALHTQPKYADVRWWPCATLPPLAYDHDAVAAYARQRLEWKLAYTNVVWSLLPRRFALTELQKVYEAVLAGRSTSAIFARRFWRLDSLSRGRNGHAWRASTGHAVPFYEPRAETD